MPLDTADQAAMQELNAELNAFMRRHGVFPEEIPHRYFQKGRGKMFCWTTKPNPGDGKYASFIYKPIGKGARSGKAERWELVERLTVEHRTRKAAKARALKMLRRDNPA
jgi:hypothetical protein